MGEHLGMEIDFKKGVFRAPAKKFKYISVFAKSISSKADANKRWVQVKSLASIAKKAQFLHLAILVARLNL